MRRNWFEFYWKSFIPLRRWQKKEDENQHDDEGRLLDVLKNNETNANGRLDEN